MEAKEEEYTITNKDIKFPTFLDKSLIDNFRKEKITTDILFQDIAKVIEHVDIIIKLLYEMITKNVNNFLKLCHSYKLNSFDFYIIFSLIKEFALAIKLKIENKNINEFKILSFDDFFKNEKYKDIIKNQYIIVDTKYEIIKSKIDNYIKSIKNVLESNHECSQKLNQ